MRWQRIYGPVIAGCVNLFCLAQLGRGDAKLYAVGCSDWCSNADRPGLGENMSKLKNEHELVVHALKVGAVYARKRGVGKFEETDSAKDKVTYLYRLLVHDKLVQPLAKGQENEPNMRHKLALWIQRQLPEDHPLR